MGNLTTLKTAGQQRVAVLVADIGEVLARHTDARGPGLPQTIHKVPLLFRHRTLLVSSSSVLLLVRGIWSREESEENASGGAERCAAPEGTNRTGALNDPQDHC